MIVVRTPFRVSFFGGGSDFPEYFEAGKAGRVLGCTIDKYSYITCRKLPPFFDYYHRFSYSKIETLQKFQSSSNQAINAALRWLNIKFGVELSHMADLPARTGIGSSSTFIVGLVNALTVLDGRPMPRDYIAETANLIERDLLKEHGGYQDPVLCSHGGINLVAFNKGKKIDVYNVCLSDGDIDELNQHLLLFYTGECRTSSDVSKSYSLQTDICKSLSELAVKAYFEIVQGNVRGLGVLLHDNWELKKRLSAKVSNSRIDELYWGARVRGAIGGKVIGAGGGGMLLLIAPPEVHDSIEDHLDMLRVPIKLDFTGTKVLDVQR